MRIVAAVDFNNISDLKRQPMKGEHCHDNGMCHDHPDDGKDYG